MPDKRRHRGPHPDDEMLFAAPTVPMLRTAVAELSWLLSRGYAADSGLKLVGDRHNLTARQRMAVRRCVCSDSCARDRGAKRVASANVREARFGVDGYNLLITIESALSGGIILIGRDGCYRDLASIHGTYRRVCETGPALEMVFDAIDGIGPSGVDWYLDRPVSNSGRLKTFIAELIEARKAVGRPIAELNIQLVDDPDQVLCNYDGIVATSDSVVLDRCRRWMNLAVEIIDARIPEAFKIDLRGDTL
ncbi:MAG: DUF434 domain-containing protein [Phycisphaerales bacterium]|nr:DUF434 domain-containing protein [Phycisphaerales bacterium]